MCRGVRIAPLFFLRRSTHPVYRDLDAHRAQMRQNRLAEEVQRVEVWKPIGAADIREAIALRGFWAKFFDVHTIWDDCKARAWNEVRKHIAVLL